MKKIFLTFAITMLTASSSCAMDLNEALTHAYKNSPNLKIYQEKYLQTIEQYPQALADFMPQVTAQVKSSRTQSKSTDNRINNSGMKNGFGKSLNIDQNIFNGGSSIAGLKAAKQAYFAAKSTLEAQEQELLVKAIAIYLQYIQFSETYDITVQSVKAYVKQLEATQQKYNLGESTRTEVAQSKSALAKARAQQAIAEANLHGAKAEFIRAFGITPTNLKMPSIPSIPNNFDSLLSKTLTTNPNIIGAKYGVEIGRYQTYQLKSQLLPTIDANFNIQKLGSKTKYKGQELKLKDKSFSKSGALSLNIPILAKGGAEYSKIRQQKSQARAAALSLDQTISELTSSCAQAWAEYISSGSQIQNTKEAVSATGIALEGVKQEEALGSRTVLEVLESQNALYQAKISHIQAKISQLNAAYNLKSLIGEVTAISMKLAVNQFNAVKEFDKIKHKLIGY